MNKRSDFKKILACVCLMTGLAVSNVVIARDITSAEFQSKIEKMAEPMNKFCEDSASYYTISATNKGAISEAKVWNYTAGYGMSARYEITVNQNTMERLNISDDLSLGHWS